jgi:peptide-methionine (R)-S-oxide reductase
MMRNFKPWLLIFTCVLIALGSMLAGQRRGHGIRDRIGIPPNGRLEKSDAYWRQALTPDQYWVTRQKATEIAYSGAYLETKEDGTYECICCGQPLFDSRSKFESGTGWPSFLQPVDENNVSLLADDTSFMSRTEVTCSRCAAHLGHVFDDGPAPTGLRYCMNSVALKLVQRPKP